MKKIVRALFFVLSFICFHFNSFSQDSSHLRISLLTCTPGEELYSTFGHSAIRVADSSSMQDIVFNYGTFDFYDPDFYQKFVKGKLMYFVSADYFNDFKEEYIAENRGITEQVLNLDAAEKIAINNFLRQNSREENKYYKYDFALDNCTTRVRDIIIAHKKNKPEFKPVMPVGTSFRQAIYVYLDKGGQYWSKLGIDILLGARLDTKMTITQSQFLPDNLMKALDSSDEAHKIVLSSSNLYELKKQTHRGPFITPAILFGILLSVIVAVSFSKNKWAVLFLKGFDILLFITTGAVGILLLFMWFGTDHFMCKNNLNLLWAWPTHFIAASFINSKKSWVKKYTGITAISMILLLLSWYFLPQQLNSSLILFVLLIAFRSAKKYMAS